jgi:hypothetical protein
MYLFHALRLLADQLLHPESQSALQVVFITASPVADGGS